MFFIFDTPRSGTTLLAQCLSCHSRIIVPHETDFIIPLAFLFDQIRDEETGREMLVRFITHSPAFTSSLGEYMPPEHVREIVHCCAYQPADILQAIYAEIARAAGKQIAGDKSPNDLLFLRKLIKVQGISPEMKIIHIIRDIRDVMASMKKANMLPDGDAYFPRFWCNSNLYLHGLYKGNRQQYSLAAYEDWMRSPEKYMREICQFLGFSFDSAMLDHRCRHSRYHGWLGHEKVLQPIDTDPSAGIATVLRRS